MNKKIHHLKLNRIDNGYIVEVCDEIHTRHFVFQDSGIGNGEEPLKLGVICERAVELFRDSHE